MNKKEQILAFLNTRVKDSDVDPDKRWVRTWNDYLQRIKYFFRWLLNYKQKAANGYKILPNSDWITQVFVQIKEKRTKRLSPYLESELWERDEILTTTGDIYGAGDIISPADKIPPLENGQNHAQKSTNGDTGDIGDILPSSGAAPTTTTK